jgi:MFS transporter, ACS family, tartrate transporter
MPPAAPTEVESAACTDPRLLAQAIRQAAWRLVPLLAIGYLISYIDRTNIGIAALTMNRELGLTATQFGFAGGMFYVGYVLFELPSNLALRRFGARRWLARIMITWGLAAAGTAFVTGPRSFYCLRLLVGACEAGFYPGVMYYLSTWFPTEIRARSFGWFNLSNPLSSVLSGPVSVLLLQQMDGLLGHAGWRWLLVCEGLPACLLGFVTYCVLVDRPREAKWLTAGQRVALETHLAADRQPEATSDLWTALRDPRIMILTASYFCLIASVLGVTLWLPQILRQRGLTTTQIGFASALPYLLACVGLLIWSRIIDRTRKYLANLVIACIVAAAGLASSTTAHSLPGLLGGFSLALIGMNACRPAFFSILPSFVQGAAAAGAFALVNSIGNLGGFLGPVLIGWLRDSRGSFGAGMLCLAGLMALAGMIALLLPISERRRRAQLPRPSPPHTLG